MCLLSGVGHAPLSEICRTGLLAGPRLCPRCVRSPTWRWLRAMFSSARFEVGASIVDGGTDHGSSGPWYESRRGPYYSLPHISIATSQGCEFGKGIGRNAATCRLLNMCGRFGSKNGVTHQTTRSIAVVIEGVCRNIGSGLCDTTRCRHRPHEIPGSCT
jgi:hypothetical protein